MSAAETATEIEQQFTGITWTRTYTPGAESWTKEGELALKSDISSSPYFASKEYVDSKLSTYVSKTDIVPSQMIPGYAENAYKATMAVMDGNGVEIATVYAKKTDLAAKQDKLPYNQYTGLYDISAFGAAQAAYVPWTGVEDKPTSLSGYGITDAATKAELDSLAAVVGAANTQLEEIA